MAPKTARFGVLSGRGTHPKGSRIALQEVYVRTGFHLAHATLRSSACLSRNIRTAGARSRIDDAVSSILRTANMIMSVRIDTDGALVRAAIRAALAGRCFSDLPGAANVERALRQNIRSNQCQRSCTSCRGAASQCLMLSLSPTRATLAQEFSQHLHRTASFQLFLNRCEAADLKSPPSNPMLSRSRALRGTSELGISPLSGLF
jgi:hypothetical protein